MNKQELVKAVATKKTAVKNGSMSSEDRAKKSADLDQISTEITALDKVEEGQEKLTPEETQGRIDALAARVAAITTP